MVNGAFAYRDFYGGKELGKLLSEDFTFLDYDRRGRGESGDTPPYSVDREIEDIDALIDGAGGSAYLYGSSSGACLALLAAAKLGPAKVAKLALYEPPYGADNEKAKQEHAEQERKIGKLTDEGKLSDAVEFFIFGIGTPPEAIEGMKQTPDWKKMEKVAPTLAYDYEVLGDGAPPIETAKSISVPTLIMTGEKTFESFHKTADVLRKTIPNGVRKTLEGQTHDVSSEAIAPVLKEFFKGELYGKH